MSGHRIHIDHCLRTVVGDVQVTVGNDRDPARADEMTAVRHDRLGARVAIDADHRARAQLGHVELAILPDNDASRPSPKFVPVLIFVTAAVSCRIVGVQRGSMWSDR